MSNSNGILRFLTCGSVDDGKSTLIGHLLHLTGNLFDDQLLVLEEESARIGNAAGMMDYSLLLDGLMAEREQGITIDVAYRYFETPKRKFIVADTPGHESYTRNMATGASNCSASLILVDARQGVLPQTRRHLLICLLMGIRKVLFAINKMDLVGRDEARFREIEQECLSLAEGASTLAPGSCALQVVPVSALHGDNLSVLSESMPWYRGVTVLEWLENLELVESTAKAPFRLPVQYVLKGSMESNGWQHEDAQTSAPSHRRATWRSYAGSVASGAVKKGDRVVILPSGVETSIERLLVGDKEADAATAGMAVSVVLAGEHDVVRGDCIAHLSDRPEQADLFKVRLVWMDRQPMYAGRSYLFRTHFGTIEAKITRIRNRIGLDSCELLSASQFDQNDIGEVELALARRFPFDPYLECTETGAFILIDRISNATAACGMILHSMRRSSNIHLHREEIPRELRSAQKGQKPCVVWLTGLSGSGKSTLANVLEVVLHAGGHHTMLMDGDNIRHGLNRDLGFAEADRIENIRRIGEVAKLMTDAGLIVITAFISPFRADRDMVRTLLPAGEFLEVHLTTSLEVCEARDPKGLYRKARMGEIPNFTGINSPYQEPLQPDLRLDTASRSVEECADLIMNLLQQQGFIARSSSR